MDVHHQNTVVAVKESRVIKTYFVSNLKLVDSKFSTIQANERPKKDNMYL